MRKNLLQKVFLVTFVLALLFVSANFVATQNSVAQVPFSKAPLGTTSYIEDFTTTTYLDAGATTASGWGDGALTTTRDLTVNYLSTYSTSYIVNDFYKRELGA